MGETRQITLKKAWSRYRPGATLDVLESGEQIRDKSVDAARADQLVADGFASWPKPAAPAKAEKGGD